MHTRSSKSPIRWHHLVPFKKNQAVLACGFIVYTGRMLLFLFRADFMIGFQASARKKKKNKNKTFVSSFYVIISTLVS